MIYTSYAKLLHRDFSSVIFVMELVFDTFFVKIFEINFMQLIL